MTRESAKPRQTIVERTTTETRIHLELNLDGEGKGSIKTTIPFLDHMLALFSKHGFFDLSIQAQGDTEIDDHHLVEDVGIVLGEAIRKAAGDKQGIRRYGECRVPMDESLASVVLDLSGRPYLIYQVAYPEESRVRNFDSGLVEDFFQAVANHGGMNLHVTLEYGRNPHHILEAIFKAFAKALDQAVTVDGRIRGVLSTKGRLE